MTSVSRPAAIFVNEGAGSAHSSRVRSTVALARRALDADMHVTATRDRDELRAWNVDYPTKASASNTYVIDMNAASPAWRSTPSRIGRR